MAGALSSEMTQRGPIRLAEGRDLRLQSLVNHRLQLGAFCFLGFLEPAQRLADDLAVGGEVAVFDLGLDPITQLSERHVHDEPNVGDRQRVSRNVHARAISSPCRRVPDTHPAFAAAVDPNQ